MMGRSSGEEGMALLVVMVLMGVMLTTGFAIVSTVDTQTSASQAERVRDSAFQLAESALNAQIFLLSRDWPGAGRATLPYGTCTQSSTEARCPDNATLVQGGSRDLAGATWQTTVRDNGAGSVPNFYSDQSTLAQPGYDAGGGSGGRPDGSVWVRAQAVAQGRTRTLVALVRTATQEEYLPHAALIADSVEFQNNSPNKEFIAAEGGFVGLLCDPATSTTVCLGRPGNMLSDITRNITGRTQTSYPAAPAMKAEARARLKATAIANGTFYVGCPTAAQLTGAVVYVESGSCSYSANAQFNAAEAPGVLILEQGSISFSGTSNFYGVIYAANTTGLSTRVSGPAVQTQGNANVTGGVLIDGNGRMVVGSSGGNLVFNINAFRAVASYGSAGVVQNTWREIKAG